MSNFIKSERATENPQHSMQVRPGRLDHEFLRQVDADLAHAEGEAIALLLDLLAKPSPNPPGDTRQLADVIEGFCHNIPGVTCQRIVTDELIHNLIITLKGANPGRRLVMNGHLDTFPLVNPTSWTHSPYGEISEGRIYGLGVSDMKGGLAAALQSLKILSNYRTDFSGNLVLSFPGDEEGSGELGMQYLLKHHSDTIGDAVITVDAGSPHVLRFGEKGAIWLELAVQSQSFHAAHVHLGIGAIEILTDAMIELRSLREWPVTTPSDVAAAIDAASLASEQHSGTGETDVLKSISVNFTVIKGGHLTNVSPESCTANIDIRLPAGVSVNQIKAEIDYILEKHPRVKTRYLVLDEPNWSSPSAEIIQILQYYGERILDARPTVTMRVGQSDSRLYRYKNVPTVVCGLTPHNMGANDEYVLQAELRQLTATLTLSALDYLRR